MKLTLTLEVEYTPNGVSKLELKNNLRYLVSRAIGEGLLTGDTDAEVDNYEFKIT